MFKFSNFYTKKLLMYIPVIFIIGMIIALFALMFKKKEKFTVSRLNRELVLFSMNGCSHCEDLKPTWDLLYNNYGNNNYIEIKQIVAQEHPDLVKQYGVTGFPTILALHNGQILKKYDGDRSYEDLVRFMNHAMSD
jgi:thioredoxin-like negative regulator of GroEL